MKSQAPSTMFAAGINRGGLLVPSKEWLNDVTKMDKLFMEYHPKDCLVKGPGLTEDFKKKLIEYFPNLSTEILAYFC